MSRVDRYLFREMAWPLFFGALGSVALIIALRLFAGIDQIARNKMPVADIARAIGYDLPNVFVMALPVAVALAASLATNRLARDRELLVLRTAGGRSLIRLFLPFTLLGLFCALLNLSVADRLVPYAWNLSRGGPSLTGARARFESGAAFRTGDYVVAYQSASVPDADTRTLNGVTVVRRGADPAIFTAPVARYSLGKLVLTPGIARRYNARGFLADERRADRIPLSVIIDFTPASAFGFGADELANLSFSDLTRASDEAARRGDRGKTTEIETSRWFKVALPTLCFVFGLCAPPIALAFSRAGSFAGILLSIVLVFVGWNTHLFLRSISLGGLFPPPALAFTTHALFLILALVFLRTQE